jgi:hypothetical protein
MLVRTILYFSYRRRRLVISITKCEIDARKTIFNSIALPERERPSSVRLPNPAISFCGRSCFLLSMKEI